MTRINDAISSYIDLEEQAAQAMFPHYFEKQKTDGVDYTIYVGGALREDGIFDPLYLRICASGSSWSPAASRCGWSG